MTKAEERKALEKIRKIVAECGADSYIATALDGALDLAESNITEDAGYSCRWYMNKYYDHDREAREQRENAAAELREAKEQAETAIREANEDAAEWQRVAKENRDEMLRLDKLLTESRRESEANAALVRELEQEILKLKAMLFDYMVAERK